jgi:hypothetical protein
MVDDVYSNSSDETWVTAADRSISQLHRDQLEKLLMKAKR